MENKNMVEEWESKINNYTTETMEERRKVVDKNKKRKFQGGNEPLIEEEKTNDENKENYENTASRMEKGKKTKRLQKNNNKKRRNDFIEYDDEEGSDDEAFDKNAMEMDLEDEINYVSKNLNNQRSRPTRNGEKKTYFMDIEDEEGNDLEEEENAQEV